MSNLINVHCTYLKVISEQIGKNAAKNGIANLIRSFQKHFPTDSLKESKIRGWKNATFKELESRKQVGSGLGVKTLSQKTS